jgi:hypothetical protein
MPFVTSVKPRVPGREVWKPFEGQEYTIFIDEPFYKFFDFAHQDGSFAHGAVGAYWRSTAWKKASDTFNPGFREFFERLKNKTKGQPLSCSP